MELFSLSLCHSVLFIRGNVITFAVQPFCHSGCDCWLMRAHCLSNIFVCTRIHTNTFSFWSVYKRASVPNHLLFLWVLFMQDVCEHSCIPTRSVVFFFPVKTEVRHQLFFWTYEYNMVLVLELVKKIQTSDTTYMCYCIFLQSKSSDITSYTVCTISLIVSMRVANMCMQSSIRIKKDCKVLKIEYT